MKLRLFIGEKESVSRHDSEETKQDSRGSVASKSSDREKVSDEKIASTSQTSDVGRVESVKAEDAASIAEESKTLE